MRAKLRLSSDTISVRVLAVRVLKTVQTGLLSLLLGVGCSRGTDRIVAEYKKTNAVLYQVYLTGNVNEAKESLQTAIGLTQNRKLPPELQAQSLFFDYARMYILQSKLDNKPLADAALLKAQFWSLRNAELTGDSEEKAGAALRHKTGENITVHINNWDADHNNGKPPRYLQRD